MTLKRCSTKNGHVGFITFLQRNMAVQWLGLHTSSAGAQLPSLVVQLAMKDTCIYPEIPVHTLNYRLSEDNMVFSSIQSLSLVRLWPHELQHARPPCPSPTPGVHPKPCPLSQWCHPAISSSVIPFSHLQSSPASGSFQMSQFFASGGQTIGVSASASILPMNIQDWFHLDGLVGSPCNPRDSRVFNTTVQKHQFFVIWWLVHKHCIIELKFTKRVELKMFSKSSSC